MHYVRKGLDMYPIEGLETKVYTIPTDGFETDGTFEWDKTTMVLVRLVAGGRIGTGYTYGHAASANIIQEVFSPILEGRNLLDIPALWEMMRRETRNIGTTGVVSAAISAVDTAMWDLKARLVDLPLCQLWGKARDAVEVYGSGGFISYSSLQLAGQLEGWKSQGIRKFKIKIGRYPQEDLKRIGLSRQTIGLNNELFVDANGAYDIKQALAMAQRFYDDDVTWFEEPVSSQDLQGLNFLRHRLPGAINVSAGEYGYDIDYFRRMLESQAVDILQADATRCGGFTGFFQAADLCRAFHLPLSSHTAPALHLHACLSLNEVCHMEYFHDHVRIEKMFFDGVPKVKDGHLMPGDAPGLGLVLKEKDIQQYLVHEQEHVYG